MFPSSRYTEAGPVFRFTRPFTLRENRLPNRRLREISMVSSITASRISDYTGYQEQDTPEIDGCNDCDAKSESLGFHAKTGPRLRYEDRYEELTFRED
ncbi:MAG TPA: hypothetical protein DEB39_12020 [Planctomycetaceae bacterium]|nr:hypothetical protein [Planctomycetaceae bacterium]